MCAFSQAALAAFAAAMAADAFGADSSAWHHLQYWGGQVVEKKLEATIMFRAPGLGFRGRGTW